MKDKEELEKLRELQRICSHDNIFWQEGHWGFCEDCGAELFNTEKGLVQIDNK